MMWAFFHRHRHQAIGLLSLGVSRLALTGISFLSSILIARSLGAEQLGVFSLITATYAYASIISEFGLRSAITAETSRRNRIDSIFKSYIFLRIIIATLVYVTIIIIAYFLYSNYIKQIAIIMLSIFFIALQIDWVLLCKSEYKMASLILPLRWAAYLGLIAIALQFNNFDLDCLAYIFLLSWAIGTLCSWVAVIYIKDFSWQLKCDFISDASLLMQRGWPIFGATLISQSLQNFDLLWIGKFHISSNVANYYLANSVITSCLIFANAIGQMALSRYATFKTEAIWKSIKADSLLTIFASVVISVCLFLTASKLIPIIFGKDFTNASALVVCLLPYLILFHIYSLLFSINISLGNEKRLLKAKILSFVSLIIFLAIATKTNTLTAFALAKGAALCPAIIYMFKSIIRHTTK